MRICLWAGAGAGKSATASGIHHKLKCRGYNIELVQEYIKKWAYQKRKPKSFDQVYIFGKQLHAEDSLLQEGVEHIITDSPIMLGVYYAKKSGMKGWEELMALGQAFDAQHPSINIFLNREGIPYKQEGRYETEAQALANDLEMKEFVKNNVVDFFEFKTIDLDGIVGSIDFLLSQ